ncbi:MAG TPA: A24 family peptidase [Candidatus Baltobacteraceae bacterium]|nr:A24 family peptidase [Candidatus Baltobacteraceae bacterium]
MNVLNIISTAGLCASMAFLGVLLASQICEATTAFEDGPSSGSTSIPLLLGCVALLGAVVSMRGLSVPQLGVVAVLSLCLSAIWYSDVRRGIVPDVFTLVPLVAILGAAAYFQQWSMLLSSAVVFVPFAGAALFSKGRGMGWGDVKLVALGGALLGAESAVLAFGIACAAAVIVAFVRNRRHEPIAFAPYLVGAIALAIALHGLA